MRVTRRFWAVVALVVGFATLGAVLARPVALVGSAGLAAWLLARQAAFVRELDRVTDGLAVDVALSPRRARTGETVSVSVTATVPETSLSPALALDPPVSVSAVRSGAAGDGGAVDDGGAAGDTTESEDDALRVALDGETSAAFAVSPSIAGAFTFDRPRVELADAAGLFGATVEAGPAPTLSVVPRAPRNVHVGEGGDEVAVAYGEHDAGRIGAGLDPAELREYVPGDSARHIDWKATARFDHPHVREFEAETDRTTALVVDHRARTGTGEPGETKLDYLREVALAFVESARELNDPIGFYAVGDGGLTVAREPSDTEGGYATARAELSGLTPTAERDGENRDRAARGAAGNGPGMTAAARAPGDARRLRERVGDDDFGRTLRPYLAATDAYVDRIDDDPLFRTIRARVDRLEGTVWTVVFTDDTGRAELREAVKLARREGGHALVFLAPTVLFEPGGLADLEAAYDRYVEFEEFRRSLARLDRVSAFEVAPGDRVGALLEDARRRRRLGG